MGDIILDTGVVVNNKPITCNWENLKNKLTNLINTITLEINKYNSNKNETLEGYVKSLNLLKNELETFSKSIFSLNGDILSTDDNYTKYLEYDYFLLSKNSILTNLKSNIEVLTLAKEL